ncbi:MAG: M1 family aminopeptidase [Bacteroidota bacterium]|nr:M1 family aminopeptidase [Bacteroidota bacterium]
MRKNILFLLVFFSYTIACIDIASAQACPHKANINSKIKIENRARGIEDPEYQYHVNYYNCTWQVDPRVQFIRGKVAIYFTPTTRPISAILVDFSDSLKYDSIIVRGVKALGVGYSDERLRIVIPNAPIVVGVMDSVIIYYKGVPTSPYNSFTTTLFNNKDSVLWTLSQPYGAKYWWPCRHDMGDKADSVRIRIICPKQYIGVSIGKKTKDFILNGNRITEYESHYPIAPYLICLNVAKYELFTLYWKYNEIDSMPLPHAVYPADLPAWRVDVNNLPKMLDLFTDLFGPYPFLKEGYGHTQFTFRGGMEHQTNSSMANLGFGLMAHELAHQWFGDAVTNRSWRDIWIQEGFASYAEVLAREFLDNDKEAWINLLSDKGKNAKSQSFASVLTNDTLNISRLFSSQITYDKSAWVVHMLRVKLGDSLFFRGLRQYINDFKYDFASSELLFNSFTKVGATGLDTFYNDWVVGGVYPYYVIRQSNTLNNYQFSVSQTNSASLPNVVIHNPIPIRLYNNQNRIFDSLTVYTKLDSQVVFKKIKTSFSVKFDKYFPILSNVEFINEGDKSLDIFESYPNPVVNKLNINLPKQYWDISLNVQLINSVGQQFNIQKISASKSLELEVSDYLANGIYVLDLQDKGKSIYRTKILVTH